MNTNQPIELNKNKIFKSWFTSLYTEALFTQYLEKNFIYSNEFTIQDISGILEDFIYENINEVYNSYYWNTGLDVAEKMKRTNKNDASQKIEKSNIHVSISYQI